MNEKLDPTNEGYNRKSFDLKVRSLAFDDFAGKIRF
jgi:hypothetical protein